jgi:hypothetical protein
MINDLINFVMHHALHAFIITNEQLIGYINPFVIVRLQLNQKLRSANTAVVPMRNLAAPGATGHNCINPYIVTLNWT